MTSAPAITAALTASRPWTGGFARPAVSGRRSSCLAVAFGLTAGCRFLGADPGTWYLARWMLPAVPRPTVPLNSSLPPTGAKKGTESKNTGAFLDGYSECCECLLQPCTFVPAGTKLGKQHMWVTRAFEPRWIQRHPAAARALHRLQGAWPALGRSRFRQTRCVVSAFAAVLPGPPGSPRRGADVPRPCPDLHCVICVPRVNIPLCYVHPASLRLSIPPSEGPRYKRVWLLPLPAGTTSIPLAGPFNPVKKT